MLLGPEGLREELLVGERSIFIAEDGGCAVQVGPRLLSVSCQKPYVHWEAFSTRITGAFDRFREGHQRRRRQHHEPAIIYNRVGV